MLAEPEWVRIKGADQPVRARRLIGIGPPDGLVGRAEASLVGRQWEMAALDAMVDRTIGGHGGVVNVVGPPGIVKSRTAREAAAGRGVVVFWTFCETDRGRIVPKVRDPHLVQRAPSPPTAKFATMASPTLQRISGRSAFNGLIS